MTIEDFQTICKTLKGVTEDIKWEHDLCFCVGEKMFLVTAPDEFPLTASFKVHEEDFEDYCGKEGFIPAPYLARYKWVFVDDINRLTYKQWEKAIADSYKLVSEKLPSKVKKQLGL